MDNERMERLINLIHSSTAPEEEKTKRIAMVLSTWEFWYSKRYV